jgi:hypothetical protein
MFAFFFCLLWPGIKIRAIPEQWVLNFTFAYFICRAFFEPDLGSAIHT